MFHVYRSMPLFTSQLVPASKGIKCAIPAINSIFTTTLSFLVGHPTRSIPSAPCNEVPPMHCCIVTYASLYILPISPILHRAFHLAGIRPFNAVGRPLSDARCILTHIQSVLLRPTLNSCSPVHVALRITKPSPLNFGTGIYNAWYPRTSQLRSFASSTSSLISCLRTVIVANVISHTTVTYSRSRRLHAVP